MGVRSPDTACITVKDMIKTPELSKESKVFRNQIFSKTNVQGYRGLKAKYVLKPSQFGSTAHQGSQVFRIHSEDGQKPLGMSRGTGGQKRQVSFERFDFTQMPLKEQETEKSAVGKTILKRPSSRMIEATADVERVGSPGDSESNLGKRSSTQHKSSGNLYNRHQTKNRLVRQFMT